MPNNAKVDELKKNKLREILSNKTYVAIGDSITAGSNSNFYSIKSDDNFANYLAKDLNMNLNNLAFPGSTSYDALKQINNVNKRVSLITILIGANDALKGINQSSFEQNINEIIKKAKQKADIVVLIGLPDISLLNSLSCQPPINIIDQELIERFKTFDEILKEQARKNSIIFVELFYITYNDNDIGIDCFHPGKQGHEKIKNAILDALERRLA
jgi:lysophospholipase L1-like esterase